MKTISMDKCPLCHGTEFETFFATHIVHLTSTGSKWVRHEMMACSGCGLVFKKHLKEPSDFCEVCGKEYHNFDGEERFCTNCYNVPEKRKK